jgi:hypothetical protein
MRDFAGYSYIKYERRKARRKMAKASRKINRGKR